MVPALLVRAVFGLLVVATAGAFVITQRLKSETPVIERVFFRTEFSPNGDGREDELPMRFDLPEDDRVTVEIVDERGDVVREIAGDVRRGVEEAGIEWRRETARFTWDGRTDDGDIAADGPYRLRVTLRGEGRAVTAPREALVDTRPPRPDVVAVTPPTFVPGLRTGGRGRVRIRLREGQDPAPVFRVYRTDAGPPRLVARFEGPRFRRTAEWDGLDPGGDPVPDGVYTFSVTVRDKAGNLGTYPQQLTAEAAERRTGASARYLTAAGPLEPVRAGAVARIAVGPVQRRLRWSLSRLGSARPLARGRADAREFGVRVPARARDGVHLLRIQAGGRRAVVPLAVRSGRRADVLVVLPAITWEGRNPVDDDRDGFPDTLDSTSSIPIGRGFAHGRLPEGFEERVSPLLRYLDRQRLRYELTTDLALARGSGPRIAGHSGVLFPGSERWLTDEVDLELRRFVEAGGRVASFGTDAFRRRVSVGADVLAEPTAPELRNVFGEAAAEIAVEATPITATVNRIGLFDGTDGVFGLFDRLELSRSLVPGARRVAAAGLDDARPAVMGYELGEGLVIRFGAPGWASQLLTRPEVGAVTRRTWALLSR